MSRRGAATAGSKEARGLPPHLARLSPSQRAAAVIVVLGESAGPPIIDRLDDSSLEKVAQALESISFLSREELAEITIDFLTQLRRSEGALRGGPSARDLVANLLSPDRANRLFGMPTAFDQDGDDFGVGDGPGGFLWGGETVWTQVEGKDPERVAEYLNGLTPNLISIILRRLDVAIASEICAFIEDEKLRPTMGYLVDSDTVDPQIESVVERMVQMEFLNGEQGGGDEDNSHLESIGELLSLLPDQKRATLVDFLKGEHESKLESIEQSIFTIDGLPLLLPRSSVPVVFKELDNDELIRLLASLSGPQSGVQEYLLGNISGRMADQFREEINVIGGVDPAEAETIQRKFLMQLMGLKRRGLLDLQKPAA